MAGFTFHFIELGEEAGFFESLLASGFPTRFGRMAGCWKFS
jgi:hypothetical protein